MQPLYKGTSEEGTTINILGYMVKRLNESPSFLQSMLFLPGRDTVNLLLLVHMKTLSRVS